MQKVDIAIGVMGAVALLATGLGIAFYDDINDLTHYHVESTETAFTETGDASSGALEWTIEVPDNTYHAMGDLTIDWSDSPNPTLDGDVSVVVTLTGPDGTETSVSETFAYSSQSGVLALSATKWGDAPEEFTGSAEDAEGMALVWTDPFVISITIQGPTGQVPGPVSQDDPTYAASFEGTWHGFAIVPETPDPESL